MAALCVLSLTALAGAEGWEKTADINLSLNQSGYGDSWTGGEYGAINWTFNANLNAAKTLSETWRSENNLKLSYGQTHSQYLDADGARTWASPEKSADRIFFESLLRMTLGKLADPYGAFTLESQFLDSSDGLGRDLMFNPMTLTESVGLGRSFMEAEDQKLFSRVGFALRQNMVKTFVNATDETDEATESMTSNDGGIEWVTDYERVFGEDLKVVSKLRAFKALYFSESDALVGLPNEDYWEAVDMAWETTLSASVAKYVQVSLFFELLYDKEVELRGRYRETLGLGLTYQLF
ncbi:DUF3078 domain-containing protein [bacterium]|nr:DUF3078 domain-containing protein [bacterium]